MSVMLPNCKPKHSLVQPHQNRHFCLLLHLFQVICLNQSLFLLFMQLQGIHSSNGAILDIFLSLIFCRSPSNLKKNSIRMRGCYHLVYRALILQEPSVFSPNFLFLNPCSSYGVLLYGMNLPYFVIWFSIMNLPYSVIWYFEPYF